MLAIAAGYLLYLCIERPSQRLAARLRHITNPKPERGEVAPVQ